MFVSFSTKKTQKMELYLTQVLSFGEVLAYE
jgi:hypothetical protein